MALDLGSAVAKIDLDISSFQTKAQQAKQAADNLQGAGATAFADAEARTVTLGEKLDALSGKLTNFGTKMTAAVTLPILGMGAAMFKSAADLEQTMGAVPQIFGTASDSVIAWSEDSTSAFGMTQQEALSSATVFGALFDQLGVGDQEVANLSQGFVGLSADLSAMWGGSSTDASNALTAALRGNYESMDKYGVNLTEAMVSQEAMNIAVADGRSEITEADKVQARYNLIMEQSADSQGQFAREADTASGSMAIMKAELREAAAGFGTLLLPAGTKAAKMLTDLVKKISGLSDTQKKWVLGIAGAAAALGPLALGLGTAMKAVSTFGTAIKGVGIVISLLTSPIGLVVIAVAALVGGLIYAYTHFEGFREIVDSVASTIKDVAIAALDQLIQAFNKLKSAFDAGGFSAMFATLGSMILNGLQNLSSLALQGIQWLADAFLSGVSSASSAAWAWIQGLADGALGKWNEFTAWLGGLASSAATWIGDTASTLWQKGVDLIVGLGTGITTQWTNLTTWLAGVAGYVTSAVGDLVATLWQKGVDLIVGLGTGVTTQWVNFTTWIAGIAGYVVTAVGDLLSTLWQKGVDLIVGLGTGVTTQWVNFKTWVSGIAGYTTSAVGTVSLTLWQKGVDLMVGLGKGVTDQWVNVKSWVSGIGGKISGAVGDLSGSLYNAGVSIMSGLKSGLVAGWNDITGWLSSLNPADWKGPEARDKKMLYKPGLWIMEGLQRGLDKGWGDVTRQLSGYTANIAGIPGAVAPAFSSPIRGGYSGGGTQVIDRSTHTTQYVALTESDFQRLLAKAEKGNAAANYLTQPDSFAQYGGGS